MISGKVKEINLEEEIRNFPLIPYESRIFVIEEEIEETKGGIIMPEAYRKEGEQQTNTGWVIATANNVTFCKPGDRIFYARYSGAWVMDKKYRVMNEEDILGKYKGGSPNGDFS